MKFNQLPSVKHKTVLSCHRLSALPLHRPVRCHGHVAPRVGSNYPNGVVRIFAPFPRITRVRSLCGARARENCLSRAEHGGISLGPNSLGRKTEPLATIHTFFPSPKQHLSRQAPANALRHPEIRARCFSSQSDPKINRARRKRSVVKYVVGVGERIPGLWIVCHAGGGKGSGRELEGKNAGNPLHKLR